VLYFDNLSRDTADAYIADGLTEELITRLGQIERLQVKSRTAVQRYRGTTLDGPAALGRSLGVAHLVSGSVRQGNGRLRVTVEMTRASTGVRVWGDSYERRADDLMAVEGDIAQAIAVGIGGQLAPEERRALAARPTTNPAAYDRMLRGNFYLARRTSSDMRRAITEFEAAARIDPSFAQAWARIGLGYHLFIDWNWSWPGLNFDSLMARGFAADDRALALDSASSDAWAVRGLLLSYRDRITQAGSVEALERAVQLDPRNAEALHQLGSVLNAQQRELAAAQRYFDRSLALDPQRMITLVNLATLLQYQGRDSEARLLLDSAVATNPDSYYPHVVRGWARILQRDIDGARADADAAVRLRPADFTLDTEPLAVAVLAAEGDSASARARADAFERTVAGTGPLEYSEAINVALGFLYTGQHERALSVLERARGRGVPMWWAMQDPAFGPLKAEARYQQLLAELRPPWAR